MSKSKITIPAMIFAGAAGMSAYVWSQQHPEEAKHVLDEARHQTQHAYEVSKQKIDEMAHSDEVRRATETVHKVIDDTVEKTSQIISQGKTETEHLLHDAKVKTDDIVAQVKAKADMATQEVKVKADEIYTQVKAKADVSAQETKSALEKAKAETEHMLHELQKEKPGILDRLRRRTEQIVGDAGKQISNPFGSASTSQALTPAATSSRQVAKPAGASSPGNADHSWAAPAAFLFWHIGFIFWHKGSGGGASA